MNIKSLSLSILLAASLFAFVPAITSYAASTAAPATSTTTQAEEGKTVEEKGVIGMFGINWKLFLAQLVNFSIILFVLWKWVFGPVTSGLTKRTEKIEASLVDAQKIAEERQTFDSWKQGEMGSVRKEASGIIAQAKQDAEVVRTELLTQAKLEQEKLAANTRAQLEQEKSKMIEEVKGHISELVVSASETILRAKLDPKKDAELIKSALADAGNKQ